MVAFVAGIAWLGVVGGALAQENKDAPKPAAAPPAVAAPKLDLLNDTPEAGKGTKEEIEQMIRTEMGENAAGDNKMFTIQTDDDLTGMEEGDLYKNEDTVFKVAKVMPKGAKGGAFTARRIAGLSDPQRRWVRLSGSGPARLSSSITVLDLYKQGGVFLHPIAVLFVLMVILTVNCGILYRRARICPDEYVVAADEALQAGNIAKFEELARSRQGLLAAMSRAMMINFKTTSVDEMRAITEGAAASHVYRLRIPARALNLIAVAAPLLGLLGTIVGMVIVFEGVAGSTAAGKASVLASGIRVKLFSTASALIVAIPSLFIFFFFSQRLNLLVAECNNVAERFIQMLSRHKPRGQRGSGEGGPKRGEEAHEESEV
jgi:biopolymer transport protein ExbB